MKVRVKFCFCNESPEKVMINQRTETERDLKKKHGVDK